MRRIAAALLLAAVCAPAYGGWWLDDRADEPHPFEWKERRLAPLVGIATLWLVDEALNRDNDRDNNDKLAHCVAGAGSSLAVGMLLQPVDGWIFSIGVGALKEHADSHGGNWDNEDLLVTTACGAVPFIAMEIMR